MAIEVTDPTTGANPWWAVMNANLAALSEASTDAQVATAIGDAITALGLGTAATHAASSFDTSGAASTAQAAAEAFAASLVDATVTYVDAQSGANDQAKINAAVTAAVTAAVSRGDNLAVVQFANRLYNCNIASGAALVQGGSTHGNALITLPVVLTTVEKITIVLRGTGFAGGLPHWQQLVGEKAGTVIQSDVVGTNDGTLDSASVIGGPTPLQGYGVSSTFTNICIVIDNITVSVPNNPTLNAFDFRGCAEAYIPHAAAFANIGTPSEDGPGSITNQWPAGLLMPWTNNNALCDVDHFSVEGFCYGYMPSEHSVAQSLRAIYCIGGIVPRSGGGVAMPHSALIGYACIENCTNALQIYPDGSVNIDVLCLDVESVGAVVYDPGNNGTGYVGVRGQFVPGQSASYVNGASHMKVVALTATPGISPAPPTTPATGVAAQNTTWRDCMVALSISGGTITAIEIDSTVTGLTGPQMVFVPSGHTITVTYTGTLTMHWFQM